MTRRLLVASGGGGDAIAAAMLGSQLPGEGGLHIATYSWDRLIVDPLPGPRAASDFVGIEPFGRWNHRVTPATTVRAPAASTLPRLAAELPTMLYLLDPHHGVTGLGRQLRELVNLLAIDVVDVVDVGGDIVATGHESTLRSPLGDSLTLASVQGLKAETHVLVAGPGLDGELAELEVMARCQQLAENMPPFTLEVAAASRHGGLFEWHVSEASGLFRAAALGVRGMVEIRDQGIPVALTTHSAEVWRLNARDVFHVNGIAREVLGTSSLDQAESAMRAIGRPSELEYERVKAGHTTAQVEPSDVAEIIEGRLPEVQARVAAREVDFVTLRRLAELLHLPHLTLPSLWGQLRAVNPRGYLPPLWAVHRGAEELLAQVGSDRALVSPDGSET